MKKINILKIIASNINLFESNKFELDLTNQMQVTSFDETHSYYNVNASIYLPKTVVFKGVNASGKTTVLELITLFFQIYIKSMPLNDIRIKKVLDKLKLDNDIKLILFYEQDNVIFKITTVISNSDQSYQLTLREEETNFKKYTIVSEIIESKKLNVNTSKSTLYESGYSIVSDRSKLSKEQVTFLKDDISIIDLVLKETEQFMHSSIENTGTSSDLTTFYKSSINISSLDPTIVQFLDPSIKTMRIVRMPDKVRFSTGINIPSKTLFEVVFQNGSEYELTFEQLYNVLSSGTIRGIQLLHLIKDVLKTGGYYIIDELELSLNKSIILDVIRLFRNHETNPLNATLIFSTHYTELIDTFDRNDQICLIHRNDKYEIKVSNYSDFDKKNQLKKSDSYFADEYNLGTAISYNKYYEMFKSFKEQHSND